MKLLTKAQLAELAEVRTQAVSAALRSGRLVQTPEGRIDPADPVNMVYLERTSSQRRAGKRRRGVARRHRGGKTGATKATKPPRARAARNSRAEPAELYSRATAEQAIRDAWVKCLDYAEDMALPVSCEQLARAARKAGSIKQAAAVVKKRLEQDLADIEAYVEHAVLFVLDGEEAAARWDEEHFDENGNPRQLPEAST